MDISRVSILLNCLGIDPDSFFEFLEWALSEQLVMAFMKREESELSTRYFSGGAGLRNFRDDLRKKTGRNWSQHDLDLLFGAVKRHSEKHFRTPIAYGEYLKLLWNVPHCCKYCGKEPPEVRLHIDHIVPVSLGGESKRHNIQFLCEKCNLDKSNKLEGGKPWLDLL